MLREDIKNIKSSKKDLRKFGLSVGIVFFILGCILFWFEKSPSPYFLSVGAALIVTGLLFPIILLPLQKVWMTFAVVMGWFTTRVILSILFYSAFTLVGVIARIFGKQFLELKEPKSQESYWHYRKPHETDRESYERQF